MTPPSFTSPPRRNDVSRTIRRRANGATVAVALRDRPWPAVLSDMIEGILLANNATGVQADQVRAALWLSVAAPEVSEAAAA